MNKPNFFIIGAPKCGTTAMADYLAQHPEIFVSPFKEPHYFSRDLIVRTKKKKDYLNLFKDTGNARCIGEASVWYLYSEAACKGIHEFNPDAKIIIMLRNPVEMLYSLHSQFLFTGNENEPDFMKALDLEQDRRKGKHIPWLANFPQGLFYSNYARYSKHVERYINTFPNENIKIILFDDFRSDTIQVYQDLLNFLDVDSSFVPEIKVINPNKTVRFQALRYLDQVLVKIGRKMPFTLNIGFAAKLRRLNAKQTARKKLSPAETEALLSRYGDDILKLEALIQRDLSAWKQHGAGSERLEQ